MKDNCIWCGYPHYVHWEEETRVNKAWRDGSCPACYRYQEPDVFIPWWVPFFAKELYAAIWIYPRIRQNAMESVWMHWSNMVELPKIDWEVQDERVRPNVRKTTV